MQSPYFTFSYPKSLNTLRIMIFDKMNMSLTRKRKKIGEIASSAKRRLNPMVVN